MTSDLDSQEPNSLRECLPRYVNGTASAAERQAIDAALQTDPELRRELQEFQNLAASFEAREQISAAHAEVLFQRIKSNIHIAPVKKIAASSSRHAQNHAHKTGWSRLFGNARFAWGMALAQFAMLAVLAITNFGFKEQSYDTLSAETPMGTPAIKLNIVFAPQATQQEVNRIMQQFGLRYVDGPSDTGMVIAALPDDLSNPDPVLEKLRQSEVVKFVEPLLGTSR